MPAITVWSVMTVLSRPVCPLTPCQRLGIERQGIRSQAGYPRHTDRVADDGRRHGLLRARLGDVEAAVGEPDPHGDRAAHLRRYSRDAVRPAQPAGPGQVDDEVQVFADRVILSAGAVTMSRNLPCRPAPVITLPTSADAGGS